jgi:hypothetical protein
LKPTPESPIKGTNQLPRSNPNGVTARPKPNPVRLNIKQRRALSVCEYYSPKCRREVFVPSRAYLVGLWLDWCWQTTAYVELPADPDDPTKWLADFWVKVGDQEYLIDVQPEKERPNAKQAEEPWTLDGDGFEHHPDGVSTLTPRWLWARRSLLLNLEQAHPFAVAASLQGGLKLNGAKLLEGWPKDGGTFEAACSRATTNEYVTLCALLHLARTGMMSLEWTAPLSRRSVLRKVDDAS